MMPSFVHPGFLALGAVAAAVPIIVHLLTRPRPVRLPLSTLRFVREAIRQRRSRHRLRDLLVLAARTAAILLLALALARPQWGDRAVVADGGDGQLVRVVVLDTSQSMAAVYQGMPAIERARAVAARYLRYRPGLQANLILAAAQPQAVFERASTNFSALHERLAQCSAVPERLDVNRAIAKAAEMLTPSSADDTRRRELLIVSDMQRANWSQADFTRLPKGTQIQIESVAAGDTPANVAITSAVCRPIGAGGGSVLLHVGVGNYSPAVRQVTVEATVGSATHRLEGACAAGRVTTLSQEIAVRDEGWQWGQVRLVGLDDALPNDNVRPLVVQLRARPKYVMITRQSERLRPASSHFLQCALAPDPTSESRSSPELTRALPDVADAVSLSGADLVVLDHPGKLSQELIDLLATRLRRGCPLLYVTAERIDATNLAMLADSVGSSLKMPVEMVPPAPRAARHRALVSVQRDQPPFRVFGDQINAVIEPLKFGGGLDSVRHDETIDEDILATYRGGGACMLVAPSDGATLAVINADLAASNLPRSRAFVPLVDQLVQRLMQPGRVSQDAVCGEPLVRRLPPEIGAGRELAIVGPQDDCPLGQLLDAAAGTLWRCDAPEATGVYRIERDATTVFAASVALPAEEADLTALPGDVLTQRLPGAEGVVVRDASGGTEQGDDRWQWFAVACVVCLLTEIGALVAFKT